jgi:hypothetical protein
MSLLFASLIFLSGVRRVTAAAAVALLWFFGRKLLQT